MDFYMQNSYMDLLLVACGFLIVLLTRYSFSNDLDDDEKLEADDSFPPPRARRYSYNPSMVGGIAPNAASNNRRHSFSYSPSSSSSVGYPKRRGRRTFGIKHL